MFYALKSDSYNAAKVNSARNWQNWDLTNDPYARVPTKLED